MGGVSALALALALALVHCGGGVVVLILVGADTLIPQKKEENRTKKPFPSRWHL